MRLHILITAICLLTVPVYFIKATLAGKTSNTELSAQSTQDNLYSLRLRRSASWCPKTCTCISDHSRGLLIRDCAFNPSDPKPYIYPNLTWLQIYNTSLSSLPCQISSLTQLTTLYLYTNAIESVSCDLSMLNHLDTLHLSFNELKTFPCSLSNITQLTHLDLSSNKIESIQCELSNLTSLTFLDLSFNKLRILPCELSTLTQLLHLNLSSNSIESVACDLSKLNNLMVFNLSYNKLEKFPCDLLSLSHLTSLNVCNMVSKVLNYNGRHFDVRISFGPCHISGQTQSSILDILNNHLSSIHCDLSKLTQLRSLHIVSVPISTFPCEISNLTKLTFLQFSYTNIQAMSCDLSKLTQLKVLNLFHNPLTTFPCGISNLNQLTTLVLSAEQMAPTHCNQSIQSQDQLQISPKSADVSVQCGLSNLTNLTYLDMSHSRMEVAPCDLSTLTQLKFLIFSYNQLKSMPCVVAYLTQLTSLNLFHGLIESVPCDLSNLTHLTTLDLGNNKLQAFPCELHALIRLTSLDLTWNEMQSVHCDLSNMTNLKSLNLSHNKLPSFPCELLMLAQLSTIDLSSNVIEFVQCNPSSMFDVSLLDKVDLSHNSISVISMDALLTFENLSTLHLDNNTLKRLPSEITFVGFKNIHELRLGNNLWVCDCEILETRTWMKHHTGSIKDKQSITCRFPVKTLGKNLLRYDEHHFCPNNKNEMNHNINSGMVAGSVIPMILCLFLLVTIITKRWLAKNRIKNIEFGDDDREFDVFISYANEDEDYMQNCIVRELEKHNFKICFHQIHFLGGNTIIDNISQCINNSRRTLVVFSNYYKASRYCMWEFKEALNKDLREGTTCLITIKDKDLDTHDLDDATKAYFQRHTYFEKDAAKLWESLLYCLRKKHYAIKELEVVEN